MSYTIQPEDHRLSYISTPRYEYITSTQPQPPSYSSSDVAGSLSEQHHLIVKENNSKELMKINEHLEVKEQSYYSAWRGVLAGISTFTILEIFRNFFF
jgi:hypothetical protein